MAKSSQRKKEVVSIVGLGYVGLPLAALAVDKGYKVFGITHGKQKVNAINRGINTLPDEPSIAATIAKRKIAASTSYTAVKKSDIVIVCVPTPVDHLNNPDLGQSLVQVRVLSVT